MLDTVIFVLSEGPLGAVDESYYSSAVELHYQTFFVSVEDGSCWAVFMPRHQHCRLSTSSSPPSSPSSYFFSPWRKVGATWLLMFCEQSKTGWVPEDNSCCRKVISDTCHLHTFFTPVFWLFTCWNKDAATACRWPVILHTLCKDFSVFLVCFM